MVHLHPQLASSRIVSYRAFGYGYVAGVVRMRAHLLARPQTHMKCLDLEQFKLDDATVQFVDSLGRKPCLMSS